MFLLIAIAAGLVTLYLLGLTVKPLLERGTITAEEWARLEDESAALLARRDRLVEELRDLELEAALNKLDDHDLLTLRRRFESEALDVVRQLDERQTDYRARIERAVEAGARPGPAAADPAREAPEPDAASDACAHCRAALPPEAVFCDACGTPTAAGPACVACATSNRPGARFCRGCGASLAVRGIA